MNQQLHEGNKRFDRIALQAAGARSKRCVSARVALNRVSINNRTSLDQQSNGPGASDAAKHDAVEQRRAAESVRAVHTAHHLSHAKSSSSS
jgi:hypothetical protein